MREVRAVEEKKELQEWMDRLEELNRQQAKYAKLQCLFTLVAAVCCVSLFVLVYVKLPAMQEVVVTMETVLENLKTVTNQLADVDFGAMVKNVDDLVVTSRSGVEQAMDQLSAIDFKTLNQAIKDLSDVVAPLAKFFNVFGS